MKEIMVMVMYKVQISLTNMEYIYYSVNSFSFFVCRIYGSRHAIFDVCNPMIVHCTFDLLQGFGIPTPLDEKIRS